MSKHHAWPSWRYGPKGEAAVFESEADVPKGWHDHPSKHTEKAPKAPELKTETRETQATEKPVKTPKKAGRKPKTATPLDL